MTASQFYLYQVNISCSHNLSQDTATAAIFEVPVSRTRSQTTIALVFSRTINVCLAFAMLLMGCELELEVVRSYLVRPLAPAAGMLCQYVLMPVMAYLVVNLQTQSYQSFVCTKTSPNALGRRGRGGELFS